MGWHSVCYSSESGGASITLFEKAQTGERDCREESVGQISVVLVSAGTKRVKHSERLELPSSALRFAPSSIETYTFQKGCGFSEINSYPLLLLNRSRLSFSDASVSTLQGNVRLSGLPHSIAAHANHWQSSTQQGQQRDPLSPYCHN